MREDIDICASAVLGKSVASVPAYVTEKGSELPLYSVGDGYEICIQNTSQKEFDEYEKRLAESGFTKYSENSIPTGGMYTEKNRACVYTGSDIFVFANYNASQSTARIVFTKPTELPSLTSPTLTASDTAQMSIAQIGVAGLGMSYAIRLKDYSFIIIDGGTGADNNVNMLYDHIVEKTPKGMRPTIESWIFTHPDPDHIGAPQAFLTKHVGNIELRSIICNFPDCSIQHTHQGDERIGEAIRVLEDTVKSYYGSKVYTVHTGQKFYFKGVWMEILMTEEDVYPIRLESYNFASVMMRFTFDGGKTFMMLADGAVITSKQLAASYGTYLKSDILQLAHHGLIGGDKQLYMYIDPEICLWATAKERYEGHWDTNRDGKVDERDVQHCLGEGGCDYNAWIRDESVRVRTHYHGGETVVLSV